MNQNIWGPELWFVLHTITLNYPVKPTEEDKRNIENFFLSLKPILPCMYCRKNYDRHLKENPIKLNNRKDLVYWLIDIHNEVNAQEGKRQYSYAEVIQIYEKKLNKKISLTEENKEAEFTEMCKYHNGFSLSCFVNDNKYLIIIIIIAIMTFYARKKKYSTLF